MQAKQPAGCFFAPLLFTGHRLAGGPFCESAFASHCCPGGRAPPAALGAAAFLRDLHIGGVCLARPLEGRRHHQLWLHAGTGARSCLLAQAWHAGRIRQFPHLAAVLAGGMGHTNFARLDDSFASCSAGFHGRAGADLVGVLVQYLLPGAFAGGAAGQFCLWRGGAAGRLRPSHRRRRAAGSAGLLGIG